MTNDTLDIMPTGTVQAIDEWLDAAVSSTYQDQPLAQDWARISKVIEELGETIQAFIGWTGQNPRKGITHNRDDVMGELADTLITVVLAIEHFTKDTDITQRVIAERWQYRYDKMQEAITKQHAAEWADGRFTHKGE